MASRVDLDDRVEQAVDGDPARGDRVGDRIDQERHVVVDDRQPHPALAGFAAGRGQLDRHFARLAPGRDLGDELRRLVLLGAGETVEFAGQGIGVERFAQQADECARPRP